VVVTSPEHSSCLSFCSMSSRSASARFVLRSASLFSSYCASSCDAIFDNLPSTLSSSCAHDSSPEFLLRLSTFGGSKGEIFLCNGVGTNFGVGVGEARPERPRAGMGFLGRGQPAPPHQLGGLWERCKFPQRGLGRKGFLVFFAVRLPFPASQYVLHIVCMAKY